MAPNPRAREAVKPNRPTNPHSGPGQPGAQPTCTRRLNLAAVLADVASFLELGRFGANDGAAAAALVPPVERSEVRGQRQTGGIERSSIGPSAFLLFIHCLARTRAAPA
jgi:hypothetical protein